MRDEEIRLAESYIAEYYFGACQHLHVPEGGSQMEFGYQRVGRSGMTRHLQVDSDEALRLLVVQNKPSDVYRSNARYLLPREEMSKKDWQGADLIFDIDAKDLGLPCRDSHAVSICSGCGGVSAGGPACGCKKSARVSLPCRACIDAAKAEVVKLTRILADDFGVDPPSIRVYFSGNEGFHIHVEDARFFPMKSRERAAIGRYVAFRGATPESMGVRGSGRRVEKLDTSDPGWRGRMAGLLKNKDMLKEYRRITAPSNGARHSDFAAFLEKAAPQLGAAVDQNVTGDVHRIFRMPGSINGKSGMLKIQCNNLEGFDPYRDAVVLGEETAEVRARCPVKFGLGGKEFGPYDDEVVSVPGYAACYMVLKGLAAAA